MAIPHFSVGIIGRGSGRSAVLSAAYRHCARMIFDREARLIDYTRKQDLLHEEFACPDNVPEWLSTMIRDRSVAAVAEAFWNKVEAFEKRGDAQLARDFTIALPIELTPPQNIALIRDFVAGHITAHGMVGDWVFHDSPGNPHVHLMTTLRPLAGDGFGPKKSAVTGPDGAVMRDPAGKIRYQLWAGGKDDFNALRNGWFDCQNRHLAMAGLDLHVDGRSFERQGIALVPTVHLGVAAKAMMAKLGTVGAFATLDRQRLQAERCADNRQRLVLDPAIVLDLITREKSVFDLQDIAKVLHRYVDDADLFQNLLARVLQDPQCLCLEREAVDPIEGDLKPARYTTQAMIRLEAEMINRATWLSKRQGAAIGSGQRSQALSRHRQLSQEQEGVVHHITGHEQIAAVVGRAGTGKTTMLRAASEIWETAGYRVVGATLAGKAADGLQQQAGIASRTLASWELGWQKGRHPLDDRTVLVVDEAGMVSSRQMAMILEMVTRSNAKLVLVGDPDQLQPIAAGAAFRAIANRIGYRELQTIYRQQAPWMRSASLDLALGRIDVALEAYRAEGRIVGVARKEDAIVRLIDDWSRDYDPARSNLILAHLRRDVRTLNDQARSRLIDGGLIEIGSPFRTTDGRRSFAASDQIIFLRNEASLGVRNGQLARVVEAVSGRITARIDDGNVGRQVVIEDRFYRDIDHGYATTIHKAQGATVDTVKVLGSLTLDRHLTYVALTRHREDAAFYYGERSFRKAGGLIALLSRDNAKATTLDHADGHLYRQALRFAESRGMPLLSVARALVHEKLIWTLQQGQRLVDLGARLQMLSRRLFAGLDEGAGNLPQQAPLVCGQTVFSSTLQQAVSDRLGQDATLKAAWAAIEQRLALVYANPVAALSALGIMRPDQDPGRLRQKLQRLASEPQVFGPLAGARGLTASKADRLVRDHAVTNAVTLARQLERYLAQRQTLVEACTRQEQALRERAAISIPGLSQAARQALDALRREHGAPLEKDTVGRAEQALTSVLRDRPVPHSALLPGAAKIDPALAEILAQAARIAERFGERVFLGPEAAQANGPVFDRMTQAMTSAQKAELRAAWPILRASQLIAAEHRRINTLEANATLQKSESKGIRR